MSSLLTTGNPKIEKGIAFGYFPAVLHLAPSDLSGFNVCLRATAGCRTACLNTAGRGGIIKAGESSNAIQRARIARTLFLARDPEAFGTFLMRDVIRHVRRAARLGLRPAFRFNGTSDINLADEFGGFLRPAVEVALNEGAAVYDYSKRAALFDRYKAAGLPIHLTFSRAETHANKRDAAKLAALGHNVAAVFATMRGRALPEAFEARPVIDGDVHDLRFLDPRGVVVGLRAKGKARRDATGFVIPAAMAAAA